MFEVVQASLEGLYKGKSVKVLNVLDIIPGYAYVLFEINGERINKFYHHKNYHLEFEFKREK